MHPLKYIFYLKTNKQNKKNSSTSNNRDKRTDSELVCTVAFYRNHVSSSYFQNYLKYLDSFPRPSATVANSITRMRLAKRDCSGIPTVHTYL